MINNQLLAFITLQLNSGVSEEEIRQALSTGNWSATDIDESFAAAREKQNLPPPVTPIASPAKPVMVPADMAATSVKQKMSSTMPDTVSRNKSSLLGIIVATILVIGGGVFILIKSQGTPLSREQANDTTRLGDIRELQADLNAYNSANGSYPPSLSKLSPSPEGELVIIPNDPKTGAPYQYQSTGSSYSLCATMEENKPPAGSNPNATFSDGTYCVTPDTVSDAGVSGQ